MKNPFLSAIIFLFPILCLAQPPITWQKAYGGSGFDNFNDIQQTSDGGYIFIGTVGTADGDISNKLSGNDIWVVKTNATGSIVWEKCYGGDSSDMGASIQPTGDGGYIILGSTNSVNGDVSSKHGGIDIWLVKLTSTGTISWEKTYGGTGNETGKDIKQTTDGGYIMLGYSKSSDGDLTSNKGDYDLWVVKTDASGTITWQSSFGGSATDFAYSIEPAKNGGYLITGETASNDGDVTNNYGLSDCWIIKLNSSGNIVWQKTFGGTNIDRAFNTIETTGGELVFTGNSLSGDNDVSGNYGGSDVWVVKTDAVGNIKWQKSLGGSSNDFSWYIRQLSNSNYAITGNTHSTDGDVNGLHGAASDIWAIELYPDGSFRWKKTIGGISAEGSYRLRLTTDGGYILGGTTQSSDGDATNSGFHSSNDIWLVKLGSTAAVGKFFVKEHFSVYPNPVTSRLYVDNTENCSLIEVHDISGKKCATSQSTNGFVDMGQLPAGNYMLRLTDKEGDRQMFKVVKN